MPDVVIDIPASAFVSQRMVGSSKTLPLATAVFPPALKRQMMVPALVFQIVPLAVVGFVRYCVLPSYVAGVYPLTAEPLADCIRTALRCRRSQLDAVAAVARLRRVERSTSDWLGSLRAVGLGATDYRTNVVRVEDLCSVVADPAAPRDARIGAAVALRVAAGDAATEPIRVAAEATASEELREVLESVAGPSDRVDFESQLPRLR
jgi:hypothetical protein